ncbi:hypothetical protein EYF80_025462 [Liparis tanakae]|uniref:Uncharacterized protein n=1 Tax=Liparis tanakae TaxID=230148 RepID=A0A4Z2HHM0_9TELE|nr:hypothetical protein EYF80_025462 [Liparis tanakae]
MSSRSVLVPTVRQAGARAPYGGTNQHVALCSLTLWDRVKMAAQLPMTPLSLGLLLAALLLLGFDEGEGLVLLAFNVPLVGEEEPEEECRQRNADELVRLSSAAQYNFNGSSQSYTDDGPAADGSTIGSTLKVAVTAASLPARTGQTLPLTITWSKFKEVREGEGEDGAIILDQQLCFTDKPLHLSKTWEQTLMCKMIRVVIALTENHELIGYLSQRLRSQSPAAELTELVADALVLQQDRMLEGVPAVQDLRAAVQRSDAAQREHRVVDEQRGRLLSEPRHNGTEPAILRTALIRSALGDERATDDTFGEGRSQRWRASRIPLVPSSRSTEGLSGSAFRHWVHPEKSGTVHFAKSSSRTTTFSDTAITSC